MRVTAIILGKGISFAKGSLNGNMVTVGGRKKRTFFVTTIFPREKRTVLSFGLKKKMILYAVCMEGEPRTLSYMDNFQTDSFDSFLTEVLSDFEENGTELDEVRKKLWEWKGPDQVIDGMEAEPWLMRRFRAAPVTDEQLHMAITDNQRASLMHGRQVGNWVFLVLGLVLGAVLVGIAMYLGFIAPPTVNGSEFPPTEIIEEGLIWLKNIL